MKKNFGKLCVGGVLLFSLSMSLTSCEDILGEWSRPTPTPVTPTVEEVIKYGFKVTDLTGVDRTEVVTSLKMTKADGTLVAEAEVSADHKITIKNTDFTAAAITAAADFWFEAEIGGKPYIAKVNIDPTTLSPETDKTLEMATLGDVILSDGKFGVAGTAGQLAKIAYLGDGDDSDATYNHGLALALEDVSGTKTWCSQTSATCLGTQYDDSKKFEDLAGIDNTDYLINHAPTGHTHAAASAARGYNSGTHPAGTSAWFLPSAGQWDKMATAASGYNNLGLQSNYYWSSTESCAGLAWDFHSDNGEWHDDDKDGDTDGDDGLVRSCLAF